MFTKLWDWSCFMDLVKESVRLNLGSLNEGVKVLVTDLIWCGVQILAVVLKLGYKVTESFNIGAEEALASLLRSVIFISLWMHAYSQRIIQISLKYRSCICHFQLGGVL